MKKNSSVWILILSIGLIIGVYYLYLRPLVILAYAGSAPSWFNSLTEALYPRFAVEKQRFDLNFFLNKSDQIIIRLSLIISLISGLLLWNLKSDKIKTWANDYFNTSTSVFNTAILRILFFSFILYIFHDVYWDMMSLNDARLFYRPIPLYKFLHLDYPSETGILVIYIVLLTSCIACIFNLYSVFFSIIAILNFILIQGFIFGFEKTDHGFATFTYAGMLIPFLLYENRIAIKNQQKTQKSWPLQLIVIVVSMCYLFSGLEKIFISKFEWINPETFRAYIQLHQAPLGLELAKNNFLCLILPSLTILFQTGFILVVFFKKLRWVFLPIGILFHVSTYLIFDVGGFFNPWLLVYIFFIDWSFLKPRTM